ncbi:hypothetical protein JCM10213_000960 [Rhodosporidiobolus nylandii]
MPSTSSFEAEHVHAVYNEIAADFSRTRHSRWPFVERFLAGLPAGSLVLDAGTGNGKYLGCRSVLKWDGKEEEGKPRGKGKGKQVAADVEDNEQKTGDLLPIGFDMSDGLLGIASGKGHEVAQGDCVDMSCWRRGAFNHAISIATIHHFATPARRIESIKQMILCVLPPSPPWSPTSLASSPCLPEAQLLIVVWSFEQDPSLLGARSARRTTGGKKGAVPVPSVPQDEQEAAARPASSADGSEEPQDVFVPWERQEPQVKREKAPKQRRQRPPAAEARDAAPAAASSGPGSASPLFNGGSSPSSPTAPPPSLAAAPSAADSAVGSSPAPSPKPTFNRYYHLFRQYELSSLCTSAAAQLGLAFEAPREYPLEVIAEGGETEQRVPSVEGWEPYLRVKEERWERENWVVELGVGWRAKE